MGDLSPKEKTMLLETGIQPGETVTIWRDYSHDSSFYPRPHTDAILVRYEGDGEFTILEKTHLEDEETD